MDIEVESAASYVPQLLLRRLAARGGFVAPEAGRIHAAVLLTDIKGFTPLVEKATASGRGGLEELTRTLNRYFDAVVAQIHAHGGDVLAFSGDALFCIWTAATREQLPEATLRAAQAASTIQAALQDGLPTRIGIGAGELVSAFAGGHQNRWDLLISGSPIPEAIEAEKQGAPGKVLLSFRAWNLVASRCSGTALQGGCFELGAVNAAVAVAPAAPCELSSSLLSLLRPYLPAPVLARGEGTDTAWLSEVRPVTVLLADLPDLGMGTPEVLAVVHRSVLALQEVMTRFGGMIRMGTDDKGITVATVFGLPPQAHENHAERAIRAAETLHEALAAFGVSCGIGIATGRVFCGLFGSEQRRAYDLCGDVPNLAARLMKTTTAEILCDPVTVQSVRGRIEFDALPSIPVKGRSQPVPVFRPAGHKRSLAGHVAPVGRTAEIERLRSRLSTLLVERRGGVVVVEAEAGLGKSTLLGQLQALAEDSGARVLLGLADAIEHVTAYYAWRPVFASVFDIAAEVDAATAIERIDARLAREPELQRLKPLLKCVLPLALEETALTAEMSGDVRAENTNLLLWRLLAQAAMEKPTVLILEDAHWLDSSSWALLLKVARSGIPLFIVVSTRPEKPAPPELGRLLAAPGAEKMPLEALAPEHILALTQRQLGVASVPHALAQLIQQKVSGNPFFCRELVQALVETRRVRVESGRCLVDDLALQDLPTTVEDVILDRLNRLTGESQLCLKVASVVGRSFGSGLVREVHPVIAEREHVPQRLRKAAEPGLIDEDVPGPDSQWSFHHVITREVAYSLMTQQQRQPLHRALANWYEATYANNLAPYFPLLAHHWDQAAESETALRYLELAGAQALRTGAFEEAIAFYSRALRLVELGLAQADERRQVLWQKGIGVAHYYLGDMAESQRRLEHVAAVLHGPVPKSGAGLNRALLRELRKQIGHRLRPAHFLGCRATEKEAAEAVLDCFRHLLQIYYLDGEPGPRLLYVVVAGLNVAEEAGPSPSLARMLVNAGTMAGMMGLAGQADHYVERAVRMAESEGHYSAGSYVWHIRALLYAQRGDWSKAGHSNQRALELIRELGDDTLQAEAWTVRAALLLASGDFRNARQAWSSALALAKGRGNPQIECWSLLDNVESLLNAGHTDEAVAVLEQALAVPTVTADASSAIDKHCVLAVTRLRQQRYDDALAAAEVVCGMLANGEPMAWYWVESFARAIEVRLEVLESRPDMVSSQRDAQLLKIEQECKALRRMARRFAHVRARVYWLTGRLADLRGKRSQALAAWRRALKIARTTAQRYDEGRALLQIGLREQGTARTAALAEAASIFTALGADFDRSRAETAAHS